MRLRLSETLDRLALLARVLTVVFGTKDKTVLNHVADGLEKARTVKDALTSPK